MRDANIRVSLFIEPDPRQIEAAIRLGAPVVELHTGRYAELEGEAQAEELRRIADAAALAAKNGIEVHAGHGLTYDNVAPIAAIPQLASSISAISWSARRCSSGSAKLSAGCAR